MFNNKLLYAKKSLQKGKTLNIVVSIYKIILQLQI